MAVEVCATTFGNETGEEIAYRYLGVRKEATSETVIEAKTQKLVSLRNAVNRSVNMQEYTHLFEQVEAVAQKFAAGKGEAMGNDPSTVELQKNPQTKDAVRPITFEEVIRTTCLLIGKETTLQLIQILI